MIGRKSQAPQANSRLSPEAFEQVDGLLDDVIDILEQMPLTLPLVSEKRLAGRGYRKAPVFKYLAAYRIEGERVLIIRIFHASQDYVRLL